MQKINLNGKEALVIDVEMDAKDFRIERDELYWKSSVWGLSAIGHLKKLPSGNWSILGTITNGVPDFDCEGWVVKNEYGHEGYRDYVSSTDETSFNWYTASQSFLSILHSQGIDTTGKKVILIKL